MDDGQDNVRAAFENGEEVQPMDPQAPPPDQPEDVESAEQLRECALFPLNDFGNGQRFTEYFGEDVLFVPRVSWFCWNGKVWEKDADNLLVRGFAQRVADKIKAETECVEMEAWQVAILDKEDIYRSCVDETDLKDENISDGQKAAYKKAVEQLKYIEIIKASFKAAIKAHRAHAKASGNTAKIDNMMKESTVKQGGCLDDLDADPMVINTNTGILKFTVDRQAQREMRDGGCSEMDGTVTLDVSEHDRAQMLSKMMPVDYDPKATAPKFKEFMERIHPDKQVREFLQRWYGLSMTGLIGEQKLVFQYGDGSNGKSVLVDLIANMMGDYAATAAIESLTGTQKRSGGEATPDLIPLIGARLVRASEPEEGEKLKEAEIKKMTGGEPIQMRANYGDTIEVLPKFKLTISGNHMPEIRGTDNGIWRRILLVKFGVIIPNDEQDEDLPEKLWAERSGVLNWLIDGLFMYLENGLREPAAVLNETKAYREESDPVGAFLSSCCEFKENAPFLKSAEIMKAFKVWQENEGQSVWQAGTITRRIADQAGKRRDPKTGLQFQKHKSSVSGYLGIVLTEDHLKAMDEYDLRHGKKI